MSLVFARDSTNGSHKPLELNGTGQLEVEAHGWDGSVNQRILVDSSGHLQVDVLSQSAMSSGTDSVTAHQGGGNWTVDLGATDNAVLDVIAGDTTSMDAKLPSLGQKNKAGSVPVTLASDEDSLAVTFSVANSGSQANMWDGTVTTIGGNSSVFNSSSYKVVSVFGISDGTDTIYLQVSEDNTNFYTHSQLMPDANGYFSADLNTAVKYVRLQATAINTITATCLGKN